MTRPEAPSDLELQDYLDNRLSARRAFEIEAYLMANTSAALRIRVLKDQDERLRALGRKVIEESIPRRFQAIVDTARLERDRVEPGSNDHESEPVGKCRKKNKGEDRTRWNRGQHT